MINPAALLRSTLACAIATGATLLIVAGSAAPVNAAQVRTMTIDTRGIDLTSPAGLARIEAEVGRAARSVCATNDDRSAAATVARQRCIKAARAAALPRLDQLAVAAHSARTAVAGAAQATTVLR